MDEGLLHHSHGGDGTTMPSRWLSLTIVAFWLGTNGWLFWHDLWPRLRPGQPPPVTIDLIQEAQNKRPDILWMVSQNDRKVFQARTKIERHGPDRYELRADYVRQPNHAPATVGLGNVRRMRSSYEVTAEGGLLALAVEIEGQLASGQDFALDVRGEVTGGQFSPRLHFDFGAGALREDLKLRAVTVPAGGSVLLPLHPVDRIRGLRPGQAWRVPVFDPLRDALPQLPGLGGGGPRSLDARVAAQLQPLTYGRHELDCLVIDYTGDELKARTWVDPRTGLVLRQEATLGQDRWVMQRD
jgi:hypothetical protein